MTVIDSDELPLKFCYQFWVENVTTLERLFSMPESDQILKDIIFDKSLDIKLHAIGCFAKDIESLIEVYQTNESVFPLLADDLLAVNNNCLKRFIKETLVSSLHAENVSVCDLDLDKILRKISLGSGYGIFTPFQTTNERKSVKMIVTREYRLMMFTGKVLQKSPIISPLVWNLTFFDLSGTSKSSDDCKRKLTSISSESSRENWSNH